MLLVNPDGLTKEQVGLAFWPEASTAQVRNDAALFGILRDVGGVVLRAALVFA